MKIDLKVSPAQHIEWLKTFGHVHRDTVKLIEKQKGIIEFLLGQIEGDEYDHALMEDVYDYIEAFDGWSSDA